MNQQQRAVVQQALMALELTDNDAVYGLYRDEKRQVWDAITALRQLLEAETEQEPVAWMSPYGGFLSATYIEKFASGLDKETHTIPLYTTPQAQPADHGDELIKILNNPEEYYPGNFDTPERANALLTGLCQEAATEIERLNKALKGNNGDKP